MRKIAPDPTLKRAVFRSRQEGGFGQGQQRRAAIYARVSTPHQQSIPTQVRLLTEFAERRGSRVVHIGREKMSGARARPERAVIMRMVRRREVDEVLVFTLGRWGRSTPDLITTMYEIYELGIGFASYTEAIDLSTPSGRAFAGVLAIFAELQREMILEGVMHGIEEARRKGVHIGRPKSAAFKAPEVRSLFAEGVSKRQIARRLGIGRTSVIRMLAAEIGLEKSDV